MKTKTIDGDKWRKCEQCKAWKAENNTNYTPVKDICRVCLRRNARKKKAEIAEGKKKKIVRKRKQNLSRRYQSELRGTVGAIEKKCRKCGEWKLEEEGFPPVKDKKGNIKYYKPGCRACANKYRRKGGNEENKEEIPQNEKVVLRVGRPKKKEIIPEIKKDLPRTEENKKQKKQSSDAKQALDFFRKNKILESEDNELLQKSVKSGIKIKQYVAPKKKGWGFSGG